MIMPWVFGPLSRNKFEPSKRWAYFHSERTKKAGGDNKALYENSVAANWPAGVSHRDIVETIAAHAQPPFPLDFLDECLDQPKFQRGGSVFGWTGDKIDEIVTTIPGLRWWFSKVGLVIAMVGPEDLPISEFDRKAGQLWTEHSLKGRLSYASLVKIASELDAARLPFRKNLQPAQRKILYGGPKD